MPGQSGGPGIGDRGPLGPFGVIPAGAGIDILEQVIHSGDKAVILEVKCCLTSEGCVAHQGSRRHSLLKVGAGGITHQDEVLAVDASDAIKVACAQKLN